MSYQSPLLNQPQAIAGTGLDAGVALHYGQPLKEQRQLESGQAVVDISNRGIIELSGADALKILNTLSSQAFEPPTWSTPEKLPHSTETLFFDLQGRIEQAPKVLITELGAEQRIFLLTEAEETAAMADWLLKMRFMMQVEISIVSDQYALVAANSAVAAWQELLVWADPWPNIADGGYSYAAMDVAAHPGQDHSELLYLVPREQFESQIQALLDEGYTLAGTSALETLRIAACRPRWGLETDDRSIPHELDWIRTAVHLNKGCYKGQETVARVHNLGRPPRRLVLLHIDGSQHTLVTHEAVVSQRVGDKEREIGRVTSAGLHHEMGQIALALVRRNTDIEAELIVSERVGDTDEVTQYAASQEVVVSPDAGQTVGRPSGVTSNRDLQRDLRR